MSEVNDLVNDLVKQYPEEVAKIMAKYPAEQKRSAVMPLLFLAQRKGGYITKKSLQDIGEIVGLSTTEVSSIIGFYTLYHDEQTGRYRVQVCTDLSCALRGADEFVQKLCKNLGIRVGETSADGLITIEEVTCLAGCDKGPLFQIQGDGEIKQYDNQTVNSALKVITGLRQRELRSVKGSQEAKG